MKSTSVEHSAPTLSFASLNWIATDSMARDQEQSHRLHEPTHRDSSIDPITGHDVENRASHPHLDDGNLTVYFESNDTRRAYLDTPFDHPVSKLPGISEDDDRGG